METLKPNELNGKPDNWALHEELGKQYARQREIERGNRSDDFPHRH